MGLFKWLVGPTDVWRNQMGSVESDTNLAETPMADRMRAQALAKKHGYQYNPNAPIPPEPPDIERVRY